MAELQKKIESDSAPVPKTTEPPLAEAPAAPLEAVEKKVVGTPVLPPHQPVPEETKALALVDSEFCSSNVFFVYDFYNKLTQRV